MSKYKPLAKARPDEVIVGVLGCMSERLKEKIFEREDMRLVVAGPDAY